MKKKTIAATPQKCRECGCTDNDCSQCIEKTGHACAWIEKDLCSACVEREYYVVAFNRFGKVTAFRMVIGINNCLDILSASLIEDSVNGYGRTYRILQ